MACSGSFQVKYAKYAWSFWSQMITNCSFRSDRGSTLISLFGWCAVSPLNFTSVHKTIHKFTKWEAPLSVRTFTRGTTIHLCLDSHSIASKKTQSQTLPLPLVSQVPGVDSFMVSPFTKFWNFLVNALNPPFPSSPPFLAAISADAAVVAVAMPACCAASVAKPRVWVVTLRSDHIPSRRISWTTFKWLIHKFIATVSHPDPVCSGFLAGMCIQQLVGVLATITEASRPGKTLAKRVGHDKMGRSNLPKTCLPHNFIHKTPNHFEFDFSRIIQ